MITIEVRQSDRLTEHEIRVWHDLARGHASTRHPFMQPEFVMSVGRAIPETKVAILSIRDQLLGFFPFHEDTPGVGRPVLHELTDYHGIIAADDLQLNATELISGCGLRVWHFDHLPVDQTIFQPHHACIDPCYVIQLDSGFEYYQQQQKKRKSSVLSQASRKRRKLERDVGQVRFDIHEPTEPVIDNLITWKKDHVDRRSPENVFQQPWLNNLLLDMATQTTEYFQPEVSTLYAGEVCIAVHYGLRSETTLVSWIPTYNPEFASYSPGQILHAEMIHSAAERGITRIELGRGENQLKLSLHTETTPLAMGAVDSQFSSRVMRAGWYKARQLLQQHPELRNRLRHIKRQIGSFGT